MGKHVVASMTRGDFLRGAVCTGLLASGSGCMTAGSGLFGSVKGAPMHGFAAPRLGRIRLGIVGVGSRGFGVIGRVCCLPGVEIVALCDINPDKTAAAQALLSKKGRPAATEYLGPEAWRRLSDAEDVDVVYNTTPWSLHVPVQLAAMRGGKHVLTELPVRAHGEVGRTQVARVRHTGLHARRVAGEQAHGHCRHRPWEDGRG